MAETQMPDFAMLQVDTKSGVQDLTDPGREPKLRCIN